MPGAWCRWPRRRRPGWATRTSAPEHLLLGLLLDDQGDCARVLAAAGATMHGARHKVAEAVPAGGPRSGEAPLTPRARRALERAFRFSRRRAAPLVEPEHVLQALLDVEGTAGQVLRGLGVDITRLGEAVEGAAPAPVVAAEPGPTAPACPACGAGLDSALAHRVVTSRGAGGGLRPVAVAYRAGCGAALGLLPGHGEPRAPPPSRLPS